MLLLGLLLSPVNIWGAGEVGKQIFPELVLQACQCKAANFQGLQEPSVPIATRV